MEKFFGLIFFRSLDGGVGVKKIEGGGASGVEVGLSALYRESIWLR